MIKTSCDNWGVETEIEGFEFIDVEMRGSVELLFVEMEKVVLFVSGLIISSIAASISFCLLEFNCRFVKKTKAKIKITKKTKPPITIPAIWPPVKLLGDGFWINGAKNKK